jgi:FkbM family methyltransferase
MPLGQYEKETARWLGQVLEPGHVFFDVGAHAGYFTLLGSWEVGETGRVVAFEPVPYNAAAIERQMALNVLSNVRLERCALSDSTGEARLAVPRNLANARLDGFAVARPHTSAETVITVATVSLDDYVERSDLRPDVLKVDVEGAELAVLSGARQLLTERPPACIISTHSRELRASCRRLLTDLGYRVSSLRGFEHELVAIPDDPERTQPEP